MNNSYISYRSYVENTNYYKQLSNAINLCNEMIDNIDELILALDRNNGEPIASAIRELDQMKKGVNGFIKHYTGEKNKIITNANLYDDKFNSLKGTIGKEYSELVRQNSEGNKTVYTNSISKVNSVNIDNNTGYIRVETVTTTYNYVLNDPDLNINFIIGCRPEVLTSLLASKSLESVNHTSNTVVSLYNLNGLV